MEDRTLVGRHRRYFYRVIDKQGILFEIYFNEEQWNFIRFWIDSGMKVLFCHLHVHVLFIPDGLLQFKTYRKAAEDGISSLALTDHNNLSGQVKFIKLAQKAV